MSGGVEMARSTFNRHKDAIEDIFGIYLECDRKAGYKYYIGNREALEEDSIQNWMLSTMSVNNIISENKSLHDRILLESIPSADETLQHLITAMRKSLRVSILYKKYKDETAKEAVIEPYCVKLFRRRWYVLGYLPLTKEYRVYSLDRIHAIKHTSQKFKVADGFYADDFFKECFGIVQGDGTKAEKVVLRAYGTERKYLRDLPLHSSQKEVASTAEYADFEYFLRPTRDFIAHLLSRGVMVKVLQPSHLADEIKKEHSAASKLY